MSSKWSLTIGFISLAAAFGLFAYVTDAPVYLGHDPATCNNCHVMDSQYENWYHAAHVRFSGCNDCHLPHQNIFSYYLYKGYSGMRDVYSFTTKTYPIAIRATKQTVEIVQANCIRCHTGTVESILTGLQTFDRKCWGCHRSVAHGDLGISLFPYQDEEIYKK